jgi:chorismate mutase
MVIAQNLDAWRVRAVRGATTVAGDNQLLVHDAIRELLTTLMAHNDIRKGDVVSAVFTATTDLRSAFPAAAARDLGWHDVPMLCASEIDVPDSQPRCLRVLLHVDRRASQPPLIPIYLRDAASLRPDLSLASPREPAHESRHEARHDPVPALAGAEQA